MLFGKFENVDKFQLPFSSIFFCRNFAHISYLPMSTVGYVEFFFFCLHLELLAKTKKDLVSTHSFFTFLLINQDLNKMKKILHTLL